MAEKRIYNVPLRREWLKAPKYKRAKKAVHALKQFIQKHMKSDDVRVGRHVNMKIWERGIKRPPHHVKVETERTEDGYVIVELEGKPYEFAATEEVKEKGKLAQMVEKVTGKKMSAKDDSEKKPDLTKDKNSIDKDSMDKDRMDKNNTDKNSTNKENTEKKDTAKSDTKKKESKKTTDTTEEKPLMVKSETPQDTSETPKPNPTV